MTPIISTALLGTQSDERLLALAQSGHERAFEAIVQRYRAPLRRYVRRLLPEPRADDVLQQAFLNAWTALSTGRASVRDLRPWLYTVARNASLDAIRQSGYDLSELSESLSSLGSTEEDVERRAVIRETLAGVAALPESQREALLRTAVEGDSRADIARDLGVSEGAVRQLVHRARTTLRAAATAITPLPAAAWAAAAGGPTAVEATGRIAELAAGAGAGAAGAGAIAVKTAAVVVAAGAIATGSVKLAESASSSSAAAPGTEAGASDTTRSTVQSGSGSGTTLVREAGGRGGSGTSSSGSSDGSRSGPSAGGDSVRSGDGRGSRSGSGRGTGSGERPSSSGDSGGPEDRSGGSGERSGRSGSGRSGSDRSGSDRSESGSGRDRSGGGRDDSPSTESSGNGESSGGGSPGDGSSGGSESSGSSESSGGGGSSDPSGPSPSDSPGGGGSGGDHGGDASP